MCSINRNLNIAYVMSTLNITLFTECQSEIIQLHPDSIFMQAS